MGFYIHSVPFPKTDLRIVCLAGGVGALPSKCLILALPRCQAIIATRLEVLSPTVRTVQMSEIQFYVLFEASHT